MVTSAPQFCDTITAQPTVATLTHLFKSSLKSSAKTFKTILSRAIAYFKYNKNDYHKNNKILKPTQPSYNNYIFLIT